MKQYAEQLEALIQANLQRRQAEGASPPLKLLYSKSVQAMSILSHQIEDKAAALHDKEFYFNAQFQLFSRFRPQEERYLKILETGNTITILGVPDVPTLEHPSLKKITMNRRETGAPRGTSLVDFWWVALDCPGSVSIALLAHSLEPDANLVSPPGKRFYEGIITYDKTLVREITDITRQIVSETAS
jgi:DICT domain-containing protein